MERISYASIRFNQMISLDIVSLFTKVPTDEILAVVQDKLIVDSLLEKCNYIPTDNLMKMLTFCVEKTYFRLGSALYQEEEGLVMGSSLCDQYWPTYT